MLFGDCFKNVSYGNPLYHDQANTGKSGDRKNLPPDLIGIMGTKLTFPEVSYLPVR